jgi:hypothetical protein
MVAGKLQGAAIFNRRFSGRRFQIARSLMSHSTNHPACQNPQPAGEALVRPVDSMGAVLALRHGNNRRACAEKIMRKIH